MSGGYSFNMSLGKSSDGTHMFWFWGREGIWGNEHQHQHQHPHHSPVSIIQLVSLTNGKEHTTGRAVTQNPTKNIILAQSPDLSVLLIIINTFALCPHIYTCFREVRALNRHNGWQNRLLL
jgi:hypothetical protein